MYLAEFHTDIPHFSDCGSDPGRKTDINESAEESRVMHCRVQYPRVPAMLLKSRCIAARKPASQKVGSCDPQHESVCASLGSVLL